MYYERKSFFNIGMTPVVKYLIFINAGVFVFEFIFRLVFNLRLSEFFGMVPANFWKGYVWQAVTYMFLHGGIMHLLLNMFILWMFGMTLESTWGSNRFLKFYFICGIGAGLLNAVFTPSSHIPTIGSSGAVYGLLMAFGILFPNQLIYFWGIFPIKAKYFVIGIGAIEFFSAISDSKSNIAHIAHLGGMFFGLIYMKGGDWQRRFSGWKKKKKKEHHLRIVKANEFERERIQADIDALLDKIRRSGVDSLTPEEQSRLKADGKRMEELEGKINYRG